MSSKLSLMTMGGKNYPTFDPPFFMGADLKWRFCHTTRQYGPFTSKEEASRAYQLLLQHEGERR